MREVCKFGMRGDPSALTGTRRTGSEDDFTCHRCCLSSSSEIVVGSSQDDIAIPRSAAVPLQFFLLFAPAISLELWSKPVEDFLQLVTVKVGPVDCILTVFLFFLC